MDALGQQKLVAKVHIAFTTVCATTKVSPTQATLQLRIISGLPAHDLEENATSCISILRSVHICICLIIGKVKRNGI